MKEANSEEKDSGSESGEGSEDSMVKATRYAKDLYVKIAKKAKHKGIKRIKDIFKSSHKYDKISNIKEDLTNIGIKANSSDVISP